MITDKTVNHPNFFLFSRLTHAAEFFMYSVFVHKKTVSCDYNIYVWGVVHFN